MVSESSATAHYFTTQITLRNYCPMHHQQSLALHRLRLKLLEWCAFSMIPDAGQNFLSHRTSVSAVSPCCLWLSPTQKRTSWPLIWSTVYTQIQTRQHLMFRLNTVLSHPLHEEYTGSPTADPPQKRRGVPLESWPGQSPYNSEMCPQQSV